MLKYNIAVSDLVQVIMRNDTLIHDNDPSPSNLCSSNVT